MRVYLDACCYCRLTDDFSQAKVREEAAAVVQIIGAAAGGRIEVAGSEILRSEISGIRDSAKRREVTKLLSVVARDIRADREVLELAGMILTLGAGPQDSLHVASAVKSGAAVFITVDIKLLKMCRGRLSFFPMKIQNPLDFWKDFRGLS